jgi:hypothetical protein
LRPEVNDEDRFDRYCRPAENLISNLTLWGSFVEFLILAAYLIP